ncbi:MAG TPA: winged helix-turn-helix domain-containing protein [Croceibacterium sp.]|jgi:DNA-binding winged helix-turn-helix (wHTH) protein/TolB-like protein
MNRPATLHSIMAGVADRRPFKVGRATIDPISRDAMWPGGQERLQPQTLKVLVTLVSRRGEVVTRDELVQLCWDGRIVGDDVINRSISLLRHFAERAGGFEIETVSRAGYRLIEAESAAKSVTKGKWIVPAVILVVGLIGLTGWAGFDGRHASQGAPPTPSISVMPFVAESNDPLARQVALAAPSSLSHMLSESGFENVHADAAETGSAARSDYILSGNVRRTSTSIDATVQMVAKRDGTIAFAHDFSAPIAHASDLPDRIGATAAAELAWTGAQMVLDPREKLDTAVASELMSSMSLTIENGDSLRAYQQARHAAAKAPDSAMAQLTFAMQTAFSMPSIPRNERSAALALGRRASNRALTLAPEFGDVYLPWCLLHSPVRMAECDQRSRRALAVDSTSSFVPGYLSSLFEAAGRIDDSLQFGRQSLANDPYKPAKLARVIRLLEVTGNSDEAERYYRQATRLWPDNPKVQRGRVRGMVERGNYSAIERFADAEPGGPMPDAATVKALVAAWRTHSRPQADRACSDKGLKPLTLSMCMNILADVGDLDGAFAIARSLYPSWQAPPGADEDRLWLDHPGGYDTEFLTGPAAKAMRTDPRFLGLARSEGLLEYWQKDGLPDFCRPPHPEAICKQLGARR